tara:strand:- start:1821 stop:2240 length:420 start_codon:yes stop_codon:yes gene_type:complete
MKYQLALLQYEPESQSVANSARGELVVVSQENGEVLARLPESPAYDGTHLAGDSIRVSYQHDEKVLENISCQVLPVARFRRNLNSVLRNMVNERHPLNRVLVIAKTKPYWVLPHDQKLLPEYFRSMNCDATYQRTGDDF